MSLSNFVLLFYNPCLLNSIRAHFRYSLTALFWLRSYILHFFTTNSFFLFCILFLTHLKKCRVWTRQWFSFRKVLVFLLNVNLMRVLLLLYHQDLSRSHKFILLIVIRFSLVSNIFGVTGTPQGFALWEPRSISAFYTTCFFVIIFFYPPGKRVKEVYSFQL